MMNQDDKQFEKEAVKSWEYRIGLIGRYDHIPRDCYIGGYLARAKKDREEIESLRKERAASFEIKKELCSEIQALKELVKQRNEEIGRLNRIIERGDEIKNNWENNEYQEAAHYTWLDDQNTELKELVRDAFKFAEYYKEHEDYIVLNWLTKAEKYKGAI